ncbi:hypothetical protein [uncultured Psychroserpens sp.]|uniref:LVIVD repeat-containing protein n=1 Tax=uncultured Psychroserpens sp. TaxID=255436 RepID=UPI002606218C|nr:hypothetical protein [uncultured Psychroserpens sp.]
MKKLTLFLTVILLWSCNSDDKQYETFNIAIPETMSKVEWRTAVEVQAPKPILDVGKIYAYQDLIFINERFKGVHIFDNSDPLSPQAVSFINIPGNEDISVKDDYLFADSAIDLLVFDISNVNTITEVERLQEVFTVYDYQIPNDAAGADFSNFDRETQVIVGWSIEERREEVSNSVDVFFPNDAGAFESGDVGVGGSLARFQIVEDYLYTVGVNEMNVFDISSLSQPNLVQTNYAGWEIETMFHADGYLYLGGSNGMFIHSIENPAAPQFLSEFSHWQGCDPVVVDGDYAYLTLRGGNECGQELSVLEVIDVSDKYYPTLVAQHMMDSPYGLGFKDNRLFVCDGASGLKVFDKTNPLDLELLEIFDNVEGRDIIPLEDRLLMISANALYQYEYDAENSIQLLSTLILN